MNCPIKHLAKKVCPVKQMTYFLGQLPGFKYESWAILNSSILQIVALVSVLAIVKKQHIAAGRSPLNYQGSKQTVCYQ